MAKGMGLALDTILMVTNMKETGGTGYFMAMELFTGMMVVNMLETLKMTKGMELAQGII